MPAKKIVTEVTDSFGSLVTTYDDGSKKVVHSNGTITLVEAKGKKTTTKPGIQPMTIKSQVKDAKGNTVTTYTNNMVVTTTPLGTIVGKQPQVASHTTDELGVQTTRYTNGVVITTKRDGTVVVS